MQIYKATNKQTGKFYIGQTKDIDSRIKTHVQSVYAKEDTDIIDWEILDTAETREGLNRLEKHYIKKLCPDYNINEGGNFNEGLIQNIILNTPNDFCFTHRYFKKAGVSRQLVGSYVRSGWLDRIDNGLYCKAYNSPNILYACINENTFHIGGYKSVSIHGLSHYIRFKDKHTIYSNGNRPPKWLTSDNFNTEITINKHRIFNSSFGINNGVSSLERAIIEMVYDSPRKHTINECKLIIDGATSLRPKYVQKLLEDCSNIKTKRLFLHLASNSGWAWFDRLDQSKIDLGSGKRQIIKGGKLHDDYNIVF